MTSHDSDSSLSDTLIDMHNLEPSFTSIDKQKSILIKDLNQSNKRHLGQYIICQLINQIHNTHLAQHLIVQDLKGDEILVQCFHLFFDKNKSSFSIGDILVLKEPLLSITSDKQLALQTFSPTDIIVVDQVDYMDNKFGIKDITWISKLSNLNLNKTPQSMKESANLFMSQGFYSSAFNIYTQTLKVIERYSKDERLDLECLIKILYLNRSAAAIQCQRYHWALMDASLVLNSMDERNEKALYRSGMAAYSLHLYMEAIQSFQTLSTITPSEKITRKLFDCQMRLMENSTGVYDFVKMFKDSEFLNRLDYAEYLNSSIKVEDIVGKGRGMIAKKYIPQGTLLMVQKAMKVVYPSDFPLSPLQNNVQYSTPTNIITVSSLQHKLTTELIHLATYSLSEADKIYSIHHNHPKTPHAQLECVHSGIITEVIMLNGYTNHQLVNLLKTKDMHDIDTSNEGVGLWHIPSMLNHSCLSNAIQCYMGDMMCVYAKCGIHPGKEVCVSYCDSSLSLKDRQSRLEVYGFKCDCDLCLIGESFSSDETKIDLILGTFIDQCEFSGCVDTWCVYLEDLIINIKRVYEKRGKHAHNFALIYPLSRLATHYQITKQYFKSIQLLKELIVICGIPECEVFMKEGVKDGVYLSHYLPGYCNQMIEVQYESGDKYETLKYIAISKKVALQFYGVNDAMWKHVYS